MIHGIFERLGLTPDADEQAIRRAYAQRLKQHRPDEDPAGFQRLHDAYQQALQWCRNRVAMPAPAAPAPAPAERSPRPQPVPHAPPSTAMERHDAIQVDPDDFLRELSPIAVQGDAAALRGWLEHHPGLWSLRLKQQLGDAVLRQLRHNPMPMPATCIDMLLEYFELDQVARGADGPLLFYLRETCHQRYVPIGRYLAQHPEQPRLGARFEPESFLARLQELCTAGDPADLWAWLSLRNMAWSLAEEQQAGRAALDWLRAEPRPMPRMCYEQLAEFFEWTDAALGDDAQATQSAVAERHLAWLMAPARVNLLARAVEDPQQRYIDVARTRRLRDQLARPFSWPRILLLALSLSLPRELGDFIFRLRAAVGLHGRHVRLLGHYFDHRSLYFWSEAGAPGQLTRPKLIVWGVRLLAALAVEAAICFFVAWQAGPAADPERYVGIATLATFGLPLYVIVFNFLLFWQTLPGPHSRLATAIQASFIPLVCALSFAAAAQLPPPHHVSNGVAASAMLLALLTYLKREDANKYLPRVILLMGAICAFRSYVVGSTLWFQWTSALAMVFWGMGQSWLTRKATPGVR
jgi:hypothetical protein